MITEVRAQLDATRLKLSVLSLIMSSTTPPAKYSHRRTRLLFEIDLAICVAEYDRAIAELNEQRQSLEDLQQVFGAYRMSRTPTAQPNNDLRARAEAAQASTNAMAADLALLLEAQDRGLLDPRTIKSVRSGVVRKCQSAITNLQLISDAMGGAE